MVLLINLKFSTY